MIKPPVARLWFAVTALVVLLGIIVQVVATARLDRGLAKVADFLLHTASPVLCVLGWLVFGPRRRPSWRIVELSALFPVGWLAFALVRGPLVGGYHAYPFNDVGDLGYPRVLLNCTVVAALFLLLAPGAHTLDRRLPRR